MATNIFNPELSQVNSAVTPEQAVDQTQMVNLFSDVAKLATQATFSYTGQKEVQKLQSQFDKLAQAREQGMDASVMQAKARALLDKSKANMPWAARAADEAFNRTFHSGLTEKTPQEKAQAAYIEEVNTLSLQLQVTPEEAAKRIALNKNAQDAKLQAESQKLAREYNGEVVFSNVNTQLGNQSVKFMDAISRAMTNGGGTLKLEDKRQLDFSIAQTAAELRSQLNSQVRDDKTGHLLVSKAEYDASLKKIDDWAERTKGMVQENSFLEVIQQVNKGQQAELSALAVENFPVISQLNAAGGQSLVESYIKAASRPEGAAKELLKKIDPRLEGAFEEGGVFKRQLNSGFNKLMSETEGAKLSPMESAALGTALNTPENAKLAVAAVEKAATEPVAKQVFNDMVKQTPDSSAVLWSERYKAWAANNKGKAKVVNEGALDSLKRALLAQYASDNNSLPTSFEFGMGEKPKELYASRKAKAPKPNTLKGEGFTKESAAIARNMLSMFTHHPDMLEQVRADSGIADMTAQEAVPYYTIGQIPKRAQKAPQAPKEAKQEGSLPKEEKTPQEAPQEAPVELQGAAKKFFDRVMELGWTEDDVTVFIDSMGFADNQQSEALNEQLTKAVKLKREQDAKKKGQ